MTAAADLAATSDAVHRFVGDAVKRAVVDLKRPILAQARKDSGGDLRLSRLGGARLAVSTKVSGTVAVAGTVTAGPRTMLGPWRWLNNGTRPHAQGRGRHPGTTGKGTWDRPAAKAIPDVERQIAQRFTAVIR